jgi:cellulose synthase/poly-beta-1,6-N-acetylglucosamine synthase-like glycosyltransferase
MYGLGEKIIAKSNCIGCYKKNCKSIEKIDIKEVFNSVEKLISQKIILVITAFKEPKIKEAIDAALNQNTDLDYEVVVSAPDKATLDIAENSQKTNKKLKIFKDPGQGKSKALNLIFSKFKADIIILTDGDVTLSLNTVQEIADNFNDPEIGCLTGRPVPLEDKKKKYGYWANFLFDSAHKWRKQAAINHDFLECSGYLFAFRKNYITQIPVDTAEDTVIPYYFWEKGYKIGYADKAEVQVTNADNWKDWISQKTRTSRGHATLHKYVDIKTTPKVKTFKNEAKGIYSLLTYPQNFKEFFWTFELALARLYMWALVFYKINLKKQTKIDNWERVESAR